MVTPSSATLQFEKLVQELGGFGRFQLITCSLWILFFGIAGWQFVITVYLIKEMDHWCHIPELSHLNVSTIKNIAIPLEKDNFGNDVFSKCKMFDYNYTEMVNDSLDVRVENMTTVPCNSWDYDTSVFKSSLVSQFDLVCDRRWMFTLPGTLFLAGNMVGSFTSGFLADRFGRKPIVAILLLVLGVSAIAAGVVPNYPAFLVFRFFVGAAINGAYQSLWTYILETMPIKQRSNAIFLTMPGRAVKGLSVLAAFFLRNHVHLQIMSGVIIVIPFISILLLPESPRWLLVKGRVQEAQVTCKWIAKINKVSLSQSFNVERVIQDVLDPNNATKVPTVLDLFRTPRFRKHSIISWLAWGALVFSVYGMILNIGKIIPGNFYMNTFIMIALSEIAGLPLAYITFKRLRRKVALSSYLIISGCCVYAMVPLLLAEVPGLIIALAFIGSVLANNLWPLTYSFTAELNPTVARTIAIGSGSSFGRLCGLIAPYLPLLSVYWYGLPYLVLGSVPVIVGLLTLLLPETTGRRLPDTLQDAEIFGTEEYDRTYSKDTPEKVPLQAMDLKS